MMLTYKVVRYDNEHTLLPHVSHLGAKEFSEGMGRRMFDSAHGLVFLSQGPGPILDEYYWYPVTSEVIEESCCLVL